MGAFLLASLIFPFGIRIGAAQSINVPPPPIPMNTQTSTEERVSFIALMASSARESLSSFTQMLTDVYAGSIDSNHMDARHPAPTTTAPAHPHSQRSHDDDADSNWFSLAFIVPFGKRHAGKEFRGFWVGAALVALIFVALFAVSFVIK